MRGADAASLKGAWEALDNAKHRLMGGDVDAALREAVRAAREALASLSSTKHTPQESGNAPLTTLYDAVRAFSEGSSAWESLITRCVELLDEVRVRKPSTPEGVEDAIACAEEVINWAESLSRAPPIRRSSITSLEP